MAAAHNMSTKEAHSLVLSRVSDRSDATAWASAIAQTAISLDASPDAMVTEYLRHNPPDRLALTKTDDTHVELSAEDAAAEVAAIVSRDQGRRRPVLADKPAPRVPCQTVNLARQRERLYDDTLSLTSAASTQAEVDAYILRLARSGGVQSRRAFGDLALAVPDADDVTEPTVSDLDDQVVMPDQSTGQGTYSVMAMQQLAAMAPAYRSAVQGFLSAAVSEDDPVEAESLLESAAELARRFGQTCLASEIAQRAAALRTGSASYLNDPDEAATMRAGGVESEVTRYVEAIKGAYQSSPPLSPAAQAAGRAVSHPGR